MTPKIMRWDPPAVGGPVCRYRVKLGRRRSGPYRLFFDIVAPATSFTVPPLASGRWYGIVVAVNHPSESDEQESPCSNEIAFDV